MHMVIRAIVFAKSADEALESATAVFEQLTGDDKPFDYFTTFRTDESSVSGQRRWGKIPWAVPVASPKGQKLLKDGMDATRHEFMENITEVRKLLAAQTDQQLYDSNTWELWRAKGLTRPAGSDVWVYGPDGDSIANDQDLHAALLGETPAGWYEVDAPCKRAPKPTRQAYIVPADVHF